VIHFALNRRPSLKAAEASLCPDARPAKRKFTPWRSSRITWLRRCGKQGSNFVSENANAVPFYNVGTSSTCGPSCCQLAGLIPRFSSSRRLISLINSKSFSGSYSVDAFRQSAFHRSSCSSCRMIAFRPSDVEKYLGSHEVIRNGAGPRKPHKPRKTRPGFLSDEESWQLFEGTPKCEKLTGQEEEDYISGKRTKESFPPDYFYK
jgi:hypothetical protein